MLIALKIHSARLTDARDIAALCHEINFELVAGFVNTGNTKELHHNLNTLEMNFKSDNFKDAFKGVFSIEKLPKDNIENAIKLIERLKLSFDQRKNIARTWIKSLQYNLKIIYIRKTSSRLSLCGICSLLLCRNTTLKLH